MLVNSCLTVYHKVLDEKTRLEKYIRYNYGDENNPKIWWFGGKGASIDKGYENANDVQIRIPYELNAGLDVNLFKIGDILINGNIKKDITTPNDLSDYEIYNIMTIKNNLFGSNPHIHIGGK